MRLEGKIAGVTGAASGIGKATALAFAREGADVAICDLDEEGMQTTAAAIGEYGRRALTRVCDVTDSAALRGFIDAAVTELGGLDIWMGNAGMSGSEPAEEFREDFWRQVVDLNQNAVFFGAQAAGRHMLEQGSGSIINTASMYGLRAMAGRVAYCTTKAAVVMMSQVLAIEWANRGVRVNAVCPGYADTGLFRSGRQIGQWSLESLLEEVPMERLVQPEEIAEACVFLASDEASAVTGLAMTVDAGWTARGA
jgi:NAD(P)-dependent dehydrogenase (short-subunit alcohol dehydrogenase family)